MPGYSESSREVVEVGYERSSRTSEIGDRLQFGDGAVVIEVVDKDGSSLPR